MKVKVLSLLVPALLVAGAANAAEVYNKDGNKLDLYGKVDGLHYFSDNSAKDGDQSYARLGFKGETQINDQLTGYGQWEYNIQANNTESSTNQSWTRLAFAGLKFADYGSFDHGRNYGVMYDIEGWTDMLPEFGGDSYTNAHNFMTGRANGVATYRNTDFFGLVNGLNFAVQYQGNNAISTAIMSVSSNKYVILLLMNVILLVIGMFMDITPAILIFTPIFLPIAESLGMSNIQFGVMLIFNMCMGNITPPVGSVLFVGCGISKISIEQVAKTLLPYFIVLFILLLAVTYIPVLSLGVPSLMGLL